MSWYSKWKDERSSKKKNESKTWASSFWYDDYDTGFDYLETYGNYKTDDIKAYKQTHNLYKLASVRRAISNFVNIVTGKNIPVTYATKSDSKTDGEHVILSADVDDRFDVSVGLALHEGSHIVLSDFKILKAINDTEQAYRSQIWERQRNEKEGKPISSDTDFDKVVSKTISVYPTYKQQLSDMFLTKGKLNRKGLIKDEVIDFVKGLQNWIEDRRIDNYIYKTAPGYRDYYVQMYDHYFNDKAITKGVGSDEFTEETWQSYLFRIINVLNENTDLNKLKGLRKVYQLLDLKNINRLKSSADSLSLAIDVVSLLVDYVGIEDINLQSPTTTTGGMGESGETEIEITEITEGDGDDNGNQMGGSKLPEGGKIQATASISNDPSKSNTPANAKVTLSKTALDQLKKRFEKQKDFLNGNMKKKTVSKNDVQKLNSIDESDTELVRVGSNFEYNGRSIGKGVDCIVVKKLTDKLLSEQDFPFSSCEWKTSEPHVWAQKEVDRGIVLGTLLGKKLQARSESRETVFNRLKKGKIDKRALSSLGYGNESVFFNNEIDQYKKANLHISIDYSGSMSGNKLRKVITSTVAIAKACQMARNINVQISIRSTDSGGRNLPYIVMVYDSRRDTFRKLCRYMSILSANNTTPEGLCFEAIYKYLIPATNDTDSYFLNFSDGQPYYQISTGTDQIMYNGEAAAEHTHRQVRKMRESGLHILSYFITEYSNSSSFEHSSDWQIFKKCYDKSAQFVDVENMLQVAKTMNEMFLKK